MSQINFRIDDELDDFISLMSKLENKSKSTLGKEIFLKGVNNVMFPYLAQLYQQGKISIKEIAKITKIHPSEVIARVAELIDDIELDPKLIDYSEKVGQKMLPYLIEAKKRGVSLKGTIRTQD
jgi:hypothetical protein